MPTFKRCPKSVEDMAHQSLCDIVAFWSNVNMPNAQSCWVWKRPSVEGYIIFKTVGPRNIRAHRWIYEHTFGRIPMAKEIHHVCENRRCVNPFHLEVLTRREHVAKHRWHGWAGKNAQKTQCVHGHLLEGDNIYRSPSHPERRQCRKCNQVRSQRTTQLKQVSRMGKKPSTANVIV